jgi:hypothetical protein
MRIKQIKSSTLSYNIIWSMNFSGGYSYLTHSIKKLDNDLARLAGIEPVPGLESNCVEIFRS